MMVVARASVKTLSCLLQEKISRAVNLVSSSHFAHGVHGIRRQNNTLHIASRCCSKNARAQPQKTVGRRLLRIVDVLLLLVVPTIGDAVYQKQVYNGLLVVIEQPAQSGILASLSWVLLSYAYHLNSPLLLRPR